MRTLICEFQPFHAHTYNTYVDLGVYGQEDLRRVHVGNTGRQSGTPGKHHANLVAERSLAE